MKHIFQTLMIVVVALVVQYVIIKESNKVDIKTGSAQIVEYVKESDSLGVIQKKLLEDLRAETSPWDRSIIMNDLNMINTKRDLLGVQADSVLTIFTNEIRSLKTE